MNQYTVTVRFAEEVVSLPATSQELALMRVKEIMAEEYTDAMAEQATYEIELVK